MIIVLMLIIPISVNANIICNDGTVSTSSTSSNVVDYNSYINENKYSNDSNHTSDTSDEESNISSSFLGKAAPFAIIGMMIYAFSKKKK